MTPQEFIELHFTEKRAAGSRFGDFLGTAANTAGQFFAPGSAIRNFGRRAQQAGQNIYEEAATAPSLWQGVKGVGTTAGRYAGGELGRLGLATRRGMRSALNYGDEMYPRGTTSGLGWTRQIPPPAAGKRLGDRMYRSQHKGFNWLGAGTPGSSEMNFGNMAVGAGALGAGYKGTKALGGAMFGGTDPEAIDQQSTQANNMQRAMAVQMGRPGYGQQQSQQGGFMSGIPTEMRYALAAGIPLMLAGGLMRGRGGMGLGALGLGAAGLGAAGAGYLGDGPRRLVGQGANALYGAFGGNQDPMSQIQALGGLSPEFGTTALMGRMPGVDSNQARGMYDMLTQNQHLIEPLLQQLQGSSTGPMTKQFSDSKTMQKIGSAFATQLKQSRCWSGYEPVPGAKAYSRGSCRPTGSKKTQKEMKSGDKDKK